MADQDEAVEINVRYMEMTARCDCGLATSRLMSVRLFADGTLAVIGSCEKGHTPTAGTTNVYAMILKLQNDQPAESVS